MSRTSAQRFALGHWTDQRTATVHSLGQAIEELRKVGDDSCSRVRDLHADPWDGAEPDRALGLEPCGALPRGHLLW